MHVHSASAGLQLGRSPTHSRAAVVHVTQGVVKYYGILRLPDITQVQLHSTPAPRVRYACTCTLHMQLPAALSARFQQWTLLYTPRNSPCHYNVQYTHSQVIATRSAIERIGIGTVSTTLHDSPCTHPNPVLRTGLAGEIFLHFRPARMCFHSGVSSEVDGSTMQ